jgi:hypothetical protein
MFFNAALTMKKAKKNANAHFLFNFFKRGQAQFGLFQKKNFRSEHKMCNNDKQQQLVLTSSKGKGKDLSLFLISKDEFIVNFFDKFEVDHSQLQNILKRRILAAHDEYTGL